MEELSNNCVDNYRADDGDTANNCSAFDCFAIEELFHTIILNILPDAYSVQHLSMTCVTLYNSCKKLIQKHFITEDASEYEIVEAYDRGILHGAFEINFDKFYFQYGILLDKKPNTRKLGESYHTTIIENGTVCGLIKFQIVESKACRAIVRLNQSGCDLFGIPLISFESCYHIFADTTECCSDYECTLEHYTAADLNYDYSCYHHDLMDLAWDYYCIENPIRSHCELCTRDVAALEIEKVRYDYDCDMCNTFDFEDREGEMWRNLYMRGEE